VKDDAADPAGGLTILEVAQPFNNHNGGAIRFGPDGMLYLSVGDGGSEGDPQGNGQDRDTLLGKILRIDVRSASPDDPYAIPADNPFVGQQDVRPEIWAYGFRNPWRTSFDSMTGQLWAADVGGSEVEEVDVVERGGNYGWNRLEGDHCFMPATGCDRGGTVGPVATYTHADGCSITGGIVYRGSTFPALDGFYLYGDFCSGRVWVVPVGGGAATMVAGADTTRRVASFATDEAGNVYLLIHGGSILRISGVS
jgi:glucose/arabinose dehydrogenase